MSTGALAASETSASAYMLQTRILVRPNSALRTRNVMRYFDKFQTCKFHKTCVLVYWVFINFVIDSKLEDHVAGKSILLQVMAWCRQEEAIT